MLTKLRATWARLLDSLWFVPSVVGFSGVALAVAMVELSTRVDQDALARFPRVFGASADSSRALLSAISASVITVVGVTFSLTMLAVAQASGQYTSRILRTFMRDRSTQVVLGVFVGIFVYCLLVVRTIRSVDETTFVPSLAVVLGIVLALGGMGALIFFVHHIATTLQASNLVERVGRETVAAVDRLFPDEIAREAAAEQQVRAVADLRSAVWHPVAARSTGYVQTVDSDRIVDASESCNVIVRLAVPVGEFVIEGTAIAWTTGRSSDAGRDATARDRDASTAAATKAKDELDRVLSRCFTIGTFRTIEQDAAFGVRQIVDIALKAISPGVNDTTTAVTCADWLGAVLVRLANRRIETPYRATGRGVRVIADGPTFESLLALSVDEIRQNAGGNVSVLAALLTMLNRVADVTHDPARRRVLETQVKLLAEHATRRVEAAHDRERLRRLTIGVMADAVDLATVPQSAHP